jgi:hypothetical protein
VLADLTELVGGRAESWDREGRLPEGLLRDLGARRLLCAQVPAEFGGLGCTSQANGEFTAHVGSLCSSLRSVMTSQGMAAWAMQRLGTADQHASWLPRLVGGELAAVAFSEPGAGSDLAAMETTISSDGDAVVVHGQKVWITVAAYADLLVVFGRYQGGAAAVLVPAATPGVWVERVADPLGCRAAGHANVRLDAVRVPAANVLGGGGIPLPFLVTSVLSWHLELLATSCRVVSFGTGTVILRWLVDSAARCGVHLVADFRRTERNRMMEIAYRFAGFTDTDCPCGRELAAAPDVERLHLTPTRQEPPATMRLVAPDIMPDIMLGLAPGLMPTASEPA